MKVYLVRHAQSEWQLDPGPDLDTSLTHLGHAQARLLADWLARRAPDYGVTTSSLCSSPLERASQTAGYLATALSLPLVTLDSLREAQFRVADDLPVLDACGAVPTEYCPPRRYEAFKGQARIALEEMCELARASGGSALAVTHGGLIKTLVRVVAGSDAICLRLCNAGVNALEWRRGRWHLLQVNLCDHLTPALRTW